MTEARRKRLEEARKWFPEQGFTEDSHIVKTYRKHFRVDRECAMRELCLLGVLSPEKQKSYEDHLAEKDRNRAEKRKTGTDEGRDCSFQDENFFFIAGYTSGGVPYGLTWEEALEDPEE